MITSNLGHNINDQGNEFEDASSSLGSREQEQQSFSAANGDVMNEQNDNPLTQSSSDDDGATKNKSANDGTDKNRNVASSYHNNHRVTTPRANETNDRLDTGSGGLTAGGAKSATEL